MNVSKVDHNCNGGGDPCQHSAKNKNKKFFQNHFYFTTRFVLVTVVVVVVEVVVVVVSIGLFCFYYMPFVLMTHRLAFSP